MNKTELINFTLALIGALAWTPTIINAIKRHFQRTRVKLYLEQNAVIAENEFNAAFTMRVGILTEIKSAFIQNMTLDIEHEGGQKYKYKWAQVVEHIYNTTISGNYMPTNKTLNAIGYNLAKDTYTEPAINFTNPVFRAKYDELMTQLRIKRFYLIQNKMDIKQLEVSEPFIEMVNTYKKYYAWPSGNYTTILKVFTSDNQVFTKSFRFHIDHPNSETFDKLNIDMVIDKLKNAFSRKDEEKLDYNNEILDKGLPIRITPID